MTTAAATALKGSGQVLVDETNPAGDRVVLTAAQVRAGRRGRVLDASLVLTCGDQVLYEGPDTPASASEWKPKLAAAREATEAVTPRSGAATGKGGTTAAKTRKKGPR